jgi:hypothetical protein
MVEQSLNRLCVFALTEEISREAMSEVVQGESLLRFQPGANFNRGETHLVLRHPTGTQRSFALHLHGGENPEVLRSP